MREVDALDKKLLHMKINMMIGGETKHTRDEQERVKQRSNEIVQLLQAQPLYILCAMSSELQQLQLKFGG
jgi:hypothetical protein